MKLGSATDIRWPDNSFDIVYSHGVLHPVPQINEVSREISRVLRPNGQLIIMVYHKNSLNYYLSIALIRRIGLLTIYLLNTLGLFKPGAETVLGGHIHNAKRLGLWKYLRLKTFIHHNTDGPENPYSKVYTLQKIEPDFPQFNLEKSANHFLNSRHLPGVSLLPTFLYQYLEKRYGWHLWAFLRNKK